MPISTPSANDRDTAPKAAAPGRLGFLNAAHFLDHYFLLIFPTAVIAVHKAWAMTYGEALALGTASFLAFALGTLPSGWLGDRWSRTGMMAIFFTGIGAASILTGFATGAATMTAGLFAIGLFASIYHPVGLALVTEATDKPGHAMAVNGVWGNMGIAAAALVTAALTDTLGWRSAFIVPGAVSLAIGLYYLRGLRIARRAPRSGVDGPRQVELLPATTQQRLRVFGLIAVSALFGGLIFNGVTVSLPKLFDERLSDFAIDLSGIGAIAAIVFAVAAFAQLPVGRLLDRFGARPVLIAVLALQAVFLFAVAQAAGATTVAFATPLLLMVFGALPVTGWLMAHYVPTTWRARAFAIEYVMSFGVGALAVPMIALAHETGGFESLYMLLAAFAAIVLATAFVLPRQRHPTVPARA